MDAELLRARREQRRRAVRRRRRLTSGLFAAAALAVAAVALLAVSSGGSDDHAHAGASAPPHRTSTATHGAGPVTSPRAKSVGPPGTRAVPILMYHVIAAPPSGAPFPGLYVTPVEFAEQMHALKGDGWHAVTLDQLDAYWRRGVPLGAGKPIVVSFDNGYQSQYTQALPVLRSLGWVGEENIQLTGLPPSQGGLGSDEVRGLLAAGWELDTQGFSHADLIALNAHELHYQVAVSREVLRRRYHVAVNWFCYPSGHYDPTVVAEVKAAGYTGSTTVVPGWARPGEDPYRLHRLRVLGGTTGRGLLDLVDGTRHNPPAPSSYSA
jgi:peptidoglycan/xylan/chitin deacetylase (PgdA/CDA1 family)